MSLASWLERRWWWMPLLALVAVNILALSWYAAVYSGFAKRVDQQLGRRHTELARLETALAGQRESARRLRHNEQALGEFYETRLAPPSERLTDVIREVRTLAGRAGLEPATINYPEDDLADYGLIKRTFSFGVHGSYAQLRRFINLLEMTESFLTLEEVQLTGRGNQAELGINLRLSTLFTEDEAASAATEAAS